jgi:hypothetical protein
MGFSISAVWVGCFFFGGGGLESSKGKQVVQTWRERSRRVVDLKSQQSPIKKMIRRIFKTRRRIS